MILIVSSLLPRHLHVVVIGFAAAFSGTGSAILPFGIGALAQVSGVQVLQPIVLALLAVLIIVWLLLPRVAKRNE